jgi:DNA-directed RNA polymerase omega subunit
MNDFDKANSKIGNRFDLVLVASERMREIQKKRIESGDFKNLTSSERKSKVTPANQTFTEIEQGTVGREYLNRVKARTFKRKQRFDEIS